MKIILADGSKKVLGSNFELRAQVFFIVCYFMKKLSEEHDVFLHGY
jgi:hypothetical protein